MPSALQGVRVLDLSTTYAGAWCARLLADYGADVVMRDPHPLRAHAPFDKENVSIPARYVLANRRSFNLAKDDPNWRAFIESADVIIDTAQPGTDDRTWADRHIHTDDAVHCMITPHGLTGARAAWPGNEMTADALSGWASVNGLKDKPPLKASGYQAAYQTGTMAFGAILCALIHKQKGGEGQRIDVSMDEVLSMTFSPGVLRSLYQNAPWPRRDSVDFLTGPVPVKDGYFAMTLTRPHFWMGAMKLMGLDDLADDPKLRSTVSRNARKETFVDRVQEAMTHWSKADLFAGLSDLHVVAGPVFTMDELDHCAQFEARDFFVEADGIKYPGAPFKMTESSFDLSCGLPEPGADTDAILAELDEDKAAPSVVSVPPAGDRPLSGYRGVVLTQAWAGTLATQILGLMGAEIIQVEGRTRFDSWRGTYDTPMPAALANIPTAEHSWNCNALFNSVNLNKESAILELSKPEGVETFKRLIAEADFVAENFSPRVMGKLGIDYDSLCKVNPGIVMLSISGFGQTGPWSPLPAIGGTIEPASGMSALLGYDDGVPMNSGQMYPDPVAGLYGFSSIALALYHRNRTGKGQHIDMSMQESNFTFVGDGWLEYALNGDVPGPNGNHHRTFAPHGIYPCAGTDQWIALAAETDEQWFALCDVAQSREWKAQFPHLHARKATEETLDRVIADWTKGQNRDALARQLAEAGVPAAPVLNAVEVANDPIYRERGNVVIVDHPEAGKWPQTAVPCIYSKTPAKVTASAPVKGAHSTDVFARLLDMTADEYNALEAAGITGVEQPK